MEKISSFTYCSNIKREIIEDGSSKVIINSLSELKLAVLPTYYTFGFLCVVSGIKPDESNCLEIILKSPEGRTLESMKIEKCTPPKEKVCFGQPDKTYTLQLDGEFRNTLLKESGSYETTVRFNGRELGAYYINVCLVDAMEK